jgi:ankyrin repeat protein
LGADVNARGGYDDGTPLHAAAWSDQAGAIGVLVDAGADIDAVSGSMHRNEPIGWAIVGGAVGAARELLARGARLRAVHVEDARKGVEGAFRCFNPGRAIERWKEIAELVAGKGQEGVKK